MGNCCGCRSEERLTSPVSKEKKQSSFSEEEEEQQKPLCLQGDPDPTPNPLGINNAVVIDIVYYEDPTPAVSRSTSCAKVDEDSLELATTDTTGATLNCDQATEHIQQCIDKTVQVSITKATGFKKRYESSFPKPKSIIEVTVTPETQIQWPNDDSTLQGQLKTKIETEWNIQLKKDYFALITVKKQS